MSKPEIIVGIPSYNEVDSIAGVTKVADEGLRRYFPKKSSLIVNADNNSPDNTKGAFLAAKTKTVKRYITTPRGITGKGNNFRNLFGFFLKSGASKLMIIDADITSATPEWVRNLLTPVFKGFEHVFPLYVRSEHDGSITNHICHPIIKGVLGVNIRQPIGGEMAFSKKAVEAIYRRKWPVGAYHFGIDIFMTLCSVLTQSKICEVHLGNKEHKPSAPRLYKMFVEVAETLFDTLDENRDFWLKKLPLQTPPIFFHNNRHKVPDVTLNYKPLKKLAIRKFKYHKAAIKKIVGRRQIKYLEKIFQENANLNLGMERWIELIFQFIKTRDIDPITKAKLLRPLYFGRFLTFYKENLDKNSELSEKAIIQQADLFYKKRHLLLK